MTTTTAQLADSQRPWIGLASFTEVDREFFAGRGEEIDELLRLVRRDILTLLYSVSGLGKTSLLQAGLFPALRAVDCLPVPIRLDYLEGATPLSAQVLNAIIAAADAAGVEAPQPHPDETLWEYLHREGNHFWSSHNDLVTPFLAFDQFEELFTLGRELPEYATRSAAFISQLADLVENRPPAALRDDPLRAKEFSFKHAPLKVLLAMREDYLADLDRIRSHFRALGQNRLRLLPMGERQARQVIALGAPLLAPGVEDRILKFLAGGDGDDAEMTIAPALLSLVLRELNERRLLRGPNAKITPDLLDVEQQEIFEDFYLRTIQDFPVGVRTFIEDKLLTTTGYRDSCALDDALSCPDVTQPILNELVNRRLLAYEDRHHTRRVELTHDVLIPVIKASRDTRHAREALAQAEQQQREAYEKARVARRRLAVVGVLLVFAAAGAIYGLLQAHRAEVAAQMAQHALTDTQHALTEGFFRTIGVLNKILTRDEREALWELAQLRANEDVRKNLLNRWFGTLDAFMRGEARGGQGIRAATGLNLEYHRLAMSDATELGRRLAAALENPQETGSDRLGEAMAALAAKMEPQAAADIAKGLAAALENPQATDIGPHSGLGKALAALAAKMEPQAAADIAKGLAAALENPQETGFDHLSRLSEALAALAAKMEPQAAADIAKGLAAALENPQETDSNRLWSLSDALAALAAKMEPQAAANIAKGLAAALENPQETDFEHLWSLGKALAVLAAKMEPQAAADIAKGLAVALENPHETGFERLLSFGYALAALAAKMEPQAAADIAKRGAQHLVAALENPQETDSTRLSSLGKALAALAAKMEPQAAADIAKRAQRLAAALENPQETDSTRLRSLGKALAALTAKMEPQAAADIAKGLAAVLENPQATGFGRLRSPGEALTALAAKMEPQAAADIAKGLAAALENPQETDSNRLWSLGKALAALAAKMEPQAAADIAMGLAAALENPQETNSKRLPSLSDRLWNLGDALAALAAKMEPQAAADIAKRGAQRLAAALENPRETDFEYLSSLGKALAALAAKMKPQAAADIAKGLAAALENPQEADSKRLRTLAMR